MLRNIAIAALGAALLGSLPAHAQEQDDVPDVPELEGGRGSQVTAPPPPPLKVPPKSAPKPAPKPVVKPVTPAAKPVTPAPDVAGAEAARLAKQAAELKAEQARLAAAAAEIKAREEQLAARAAELDAEESRLAQLKSQQEAELAARAAELDRQRDEPTVQAHADTGRQPLQTRAVDFETAIRSCSIAGEDAALDRNYYSAEYDRTPTFHRGRVAELRGTMRLETRRGYTLVDTVCEIDGYSEAVRFDFLR